MSQSSSYTNAQSGLEVSRYKYPTVLQTWRLKLAFVVFTYDEDIFLHGMIQSLIVGSYSFLCFHRGPKSCSRDLSRLR